MNNNWKFKGVTFTGIDWKTDIGELWRIQQDYPYVEWGVLASRNWRTNGNRYFNPAFLKALDRGLNLSVHLCGKLAREAINGNIEPFKDWAIGEYFLFNRCQINVAGDTNNPRELEYTDYWTYYFNEVIIQQKGADDCALFLNTDVSDYVTVLLDASGGKGIDTEIKTLNVPTKVGYAGGINPENVENKLKYLLENVETPFWIDMESGVRTDDWFDLDKVKKVLEICDRVINQ